MITELSIRNLAIIDEQSITFSPGFNVISGETGAGKSLMLQALGFLMGERLSVGAIREGADELEVHCVFDLSGRVLDLPEVAQGKELLLSRTLPREGRGKVLINGRPGTVSLLEEIVPRLVSIASQHQSVRLLKPQYHLELLDEYSGTTEQVAQFSVRYREYSERQREYEALVQTRAERIAKRSELEARASELKKITLKPGLRIELEASVKRLSGGEQVLDLGAVLLAALRAEEGPEAILKRLTTDIQKLERVVGQDLGTKVALQALSELESQIDRMVSAVELDGETLERARGELSELARLERKYHLTDTELFELLRKTENELLALSDDGQSESFQRELETLRAELLKEAQEISEKRRRSKTTLEREASRDLTEVAMNGARLVVEVSPTEIRATGIDSVRFMLSLNGSNTPRELGEGASGGELSRLTLVLKRLLGDRGGVPVLVFDEVDSGVSGGVARAVGKMLRDISKGSQVICVTHLPQVASLAVRHLLVKKVGTKSARTVVEPLKESERIDEIARMLSGFKVTDAARASARELIFED